MSNEFRHTPFSADAAMAVFDAERAHNNISSAEAVRAWRAGDWQEFYDHASWLIAEKAVGYKHLEMPLASVLDKVQI